MIYTHVGIVHTAAAAELVVWGYHTSYTRRNRHNQDHRTESHKCPYIMSTTTE